LPENWPRTWPRIAVERATRGRPRTSSTRGPLYQLSRDRERRARKLCRGNLPAPASASANLAPVLAHVVDVLAEQLRQVFRGAGDDPVADDEVRRALNAHLGGELARLVDLFLHLGRGHVLLEPGYVEAQLLGDPQGRGLVGLTLALQHRPVEFPIFALHLGGKRYAGGLLGALGQNRQLLEDDPHLL